MKFPVLYAVLSVAVCALTLTHAQAHNVWLEPDAEGAYTVQFGGHEGKLESFSLDKLKTVHAYDRRGRDIAVHIQPAPGGAKVIPTRQPAMLAAYFENGYFSKTASGPMVNKPMNENAGAISGVYAVKYHKTIVQWGAVAKRELGQELELIPQQADTPKAGEPLALQVRFKGLPIAGVRVSLGENQQVVQSDQEGRLVLYPKAGMNQVLAIRRAPVTGDARTSSISHEYLLAFPAHP
jgi:uncharacterized GH25 family protein